MDTVTQLERRAERKNKIRLTHQLPVIALTLNIPANLTNQAWVPMLFKSALNSFLAKMEEMDVKVIEQQFATTPTYEALFAVDIRSSTLLKKAVIEIEHNHPYGALFNFDVMCRQGKTISRRSSYMRPRPCLICDDIAQRCAALKRHSPQQIEHAILSIINK
ncbi:hypothetical protein NM09_07175 [Vibrio caribbeanicus]|uniref:Uncharacterized protein n=1 Tax=Vibrio caribbeanicus TaxID=701175 RepID=A0ACC4NY55_9VIBR|nr:citrate lyase holo-[acyl-carrier protein] synthase [Vibrio caribbeanicus]KHD25494.1 hypothetical protein NM09_07175 [Vibrio caribbeanicus]